MFLNSAVACESDTYETNYAEWRFSNGEPYLYVQADNYYTLGYLEGQNLAFQTAWMKFMILLQAEQIGLPYKVAIYYALDYLDYFPEEYILEMQGIADAIDVVQIPFMGQVYEITIDFLGVLAQNCFWDVYYGKIVPMLSGYPQPPLIVAGCTAIGSNTGKKAILGQTFDISLLMQPTASWVYIKIQGKKVFSFRTGSMLAMGGVNKHGVAIETIPNSYSIEIIGRGGYTFDANVYENPYFKAFLIYPTNYVERYNRVSELCQTYS